MDYGFVQTSKNYLWWLIAYVNLPQLWGPVVWTNTSLDVAVKAFADMINNCNQLTYVK